MFKTVWIIRLYKAGLQVKNVLNGFLKGELISDNLKGVVVSLLVHGLF